MSNQLNRQNIYSGLSLEQPKASFGKRLIAYCIDLSIISTFYYAVFLVLMLVFVPLMMGIEYSNIDHSKIFNSIFTSILFILLFVVVILLILSTHSAYFIYFETRKRGSSPGKSIMGLRVISIDGRNITFSQSLIREMMRVVDGGLILPGIISFYLSDKNQRLGDLASNTMVIYLKKNETINEFLFITQKQYFTFYEKLKPEIPNEDVIIKYLAFSMNYFIRGKADPVEYNKWLPIARSHYRSALAEKVDEITALKFFSELCNQTIHNLRKGKIKNKTEGESYGEHEYQ